MPAQESSSVKRVMSSQRSTSWMASRSTEREMHPARSGMPRNEEPSWESPYRIRATKARTTMALLSERASTLYQQKEVAEDEVHDLALLKLQSNPFELAHKAGAKARVSAARFFAGRPDDGALIAVSGYPLHYAVLVTTSGTIASSWDDTGNADSYLADLHVHHGHNGGPVYRISDGSVIGMCDSFRLAPVNPYNKYVALAYNPCLSSTFPPISIVAISTKTSP